MALPHLLKMPASLRYAVEKHAKISTSITCIGIGSAMG
jgi:hypothetical protein